MSEDKIQRYKDIKIPIKKRKEGSVKFE